jgi:hypothetical protein
VADLDYVEFFKLFETFEHTVFQFETRESYAGVAAKPFSHFLAGNLTKVWDADAPWLQGVRARTAEGIRQARVRIVSEPWSDYTRFGLWECRTSIEAGEDIRYLSRERAVALSLPQHDFRLFDSQALVIMHYDDATNKILRRELITHFAAVIRHNYWRDVAWHHALPRDDYVEQVGELVVTP